MKGFIRISYVNVLGMDQGEVIKVRYFTNKHQRGNFKGVHYMTTKGSEKLIKVVEGQMRTRGCTSIEIIDQREQL